MNMEKRACNSQLEPQVRKGPWTMEEDLILINYIANHGEGVWNSLARSAGLKRTGKSCRLRWLNYLRPDVRRGNITPEEHLLIVELHSKWGNRWSKIAKHLPGRTDNEIKNYWRTRIQKHIKQADNFTNLPLNLDNNNINMDEPTFTDQQVVSSCVPAVHPVSQSYDPPNSSFQENMSNFQYPNFPTQSIDHNIWSTDDFWPMHLIKLINTPIYY